MPPGQEGGPLRQVLHRQLLLQVPIVGDRHILVGAGHERDGPAVVLGLGWFFLNVDLMAAGGQGQLRFKAYAEESRWVREWAEEPIQPTSSGTATKSHFALTAVGHSATGTDAPRTPQMASLWVSATLWPDCPYPYWVPF